VARSSPVSGRMDIPARIGLVQSRSGFVGGDNRSVEVDVEGSSAAGSYSQRNHIENCPMFHPPSVPSNARTAEPRNIYSREPMEIVSIPVCCL